MSHAVLLVFGKVLELTSCKLRKSANKPPLRDAEPNETDVKC